MQIWHGNLFKWVIRDRAGMQIIKAAENISKIPNKETTKAAVMAARQDILPNEVDPIKAESAAIFKVKWMEAKTDQKYLELLAKHKQMYEKE